jgi:hypothetical protein
MIKPTPGDPAAGLVQQASLFPRRVTMKRNANLVTLLFLGSLSMAAGAADQAPATPNAAAVKEAPPAPLFTQLDANKDGYVTKDEAKRSAEVTARFTKLDADRDGKLAASEFKMGMEPKL